MPSYEYESLRFRGAAIAVGSTRPAATMIADVRRTATELFAAAAGMPAAAWQRTVRWTTGQETPASRIVWARLAEVLIHHVDLDIGYQPGDWPSPFVKEFLPRVVASLNARDGAMTAIRLHGTDTGRGFNIGNSPAAPAVAGPEHDLLAWLLGRSGGSALARNPCTPLPAVPPIY